jgi:hypothetical protein
MMCLSLVFQTRIRSLQPQGVVKEAAFKEFTRHEAPTAEAARAILEKAGVAHYWDAAANFDPSAAPLPSAVQ